ncbi:MAG TPA: hypothetical protein VIH72_14075 [Candidatus Acidoferrales bacterium]
MKENAGSETKTPIRFFFVSCVALAMACTGAGVPQAAAADDSKDVDKTEVRNNAASLLADLFHEEKNVDKVLIIKHNSAAFGDLIKSISKTASDGEAKLEALAKDDKTLNLHALELPPGEKATREAISKTKEHEMLFSTGETFGLNLLLSQTDALDYGSHLAKIAAENSSSPEQEKEFHALDVALKNLFNRVVARIRALPGK